MAIAPLDVEQRDTTVVHITCDTCRGDVDNCPSAPYVFRKSWQELILEAPADLKRECQRWHLLARPAKRQEEFWSAYYNLEYTPKPS